MMRRTMTMLAALVLLLATAIQAEETAPRPDTEANRVLDKLVSIENERTSLADLLEQAAGQGASLVVNREGIQEQDELAIRVKDVPLREVIEMICHAARVDCRISPSGIVSIARREGEGPNQRAMVERLREMRERFRPDGMRPEGRDGNRGQGGEFRPRQRPQAPEEQPQKQPVEPVPQGEDGAVF